MPRSFKMDPLSSQSNPYSNYVAEMEARIAFAKMRRKGMTPEAIIQKLCEENQQRYQERKPVVLGMLKGKQKEIHDVASSLIEESQMACTAGSENDFLDAVLYKRPLLAKRIQILNDEIEKLTRNQEACEMNMANQIKRRQELKSILLELKSFLQKMPTTHPDSDQILQLGNKLCMAISKTKFKV